jgi:glutamyl-tRNA reductase
MTNTEKEHEHYEALEKAKAEIRQKAKRGMSWQQIQEIVNSYSDFGKLAKRKLRRIAAEKAECEIPYTPALVKSKRGTWGAVMKGNRASSLTKKECIERGLKPGPGNY